MKKVIIFLFIIISIILINKGNEETVLIPQESIRYRIIANSNNVEDQAVKLEIKEELEPFIVDSLKDSKNIDEARDNLNNLVPKLDDILKNKNISYRINYGQNYFPEKIYKNVTYQEGNYESLVVTLGDGLGDNWWCVLFPPLCLLEAKETELNDIEYAFYIKEVIDKYKS